MSRTVWVIIILVIILAAGGLLLASRTGTPTPIQSGPTQTIISPTSTLPASSSAQPSKAAEEITVTASEFKFTPDKITVKKGQKVTINFKNGGTVAHNFIIAGLNISSKTIDPGQSDIMSFTPEQTGSFQFFCNVDAHKDRGMTGTLTVE